MQAVVCNRGSVSARPPPPCGEGRGGGRMAFGIETRNAMAREKVSFARHLRRVKTIPERKLWRELRALNEIGCHFRQQVPIGPFIVDFAELSARIVIEVDGDGHAGAETYDAERTRWLVGQGFHVVRFDNRAVIDNLAGVVTEIRQLITERVFPLVDIGSGTPKTNDATTPTPALPTRGRVKKSRPI